MVLRKNQGFPECQARAELLPQPWGIPRNRTLKTVSPLIFYPEWVTLSFKNENSPENTVKLHSQMISRKSPYWFPLRVKKRRRRNDSGNNRELVWGDRRSCHQLEVIEVSLCFLFTSFNKGSSVRLVVQIIVNNKWTVIKAQPRRWDSHKKT